MKVCWSAGSIVCLADFASQAQAAAVGRGFFMPDVTLSEKGEKYFRGSTDSILMTQTRVRQTLLSELSFADYGTSRSQVPMQQNLVTVFFLLKSVLISRAARFILWFFLFKQAEQPFGDFLGTYWEYMGSFFSMDRAGAGYIPVAEKL